MEIFENLELNEIENTTYQSLRDIKKAFSYLRREPKLLKCIYNVGLQANLWDISELVTDGGGPSPL